MAYVLLSCGSNYNFAVGNNTYVTTQIEEVVEHLRKVLDEKMPENIYTRGNYKLKAPPIKVLDALVPIGYHVISSGGSDSRFIWTLAKPNASTTTTGTTNGLIATEISPPSRSDNQRDPMSPLDLHSYSPESICNAWFLASPTVTAASLNVVPPLVSSCFSACRTSSHKDHSHQHHHQQGLSTRTATRATTNSEATTIKPLIVIGEEAEAVETTIREEVHHHQTVEVGDTDDDLIDMQTTTTARQQHHDHQQQQRRHQQRDAFQTTTHSDYGTDKCCTCSTGFDRRRQTRPKLLSEEGGPHGPDDLTASPDFMDNSLSYWDLFLSVKVIITIMVTTEDKVNRL